MAVRVGVLRDSSLVARRIAPFRNLLYAAPAYVHARGFPKEPEDLADHACLGFINYASWPDWVLKRGAQQKTIRPIGPLNSDSSEAILQAAIEGAGIILTPDWLADAAVRAGELVQVLTEWQAAEEGGIYAVMPPGRLVPSKTRVFVDEIAHAVLAGLDHERAKTKRRVAKRKEG